MRKTFLITGTTSGLGKASSLLLAKLDQQVILLSRDQNKAQKTQEEIIKLSGSHYVDYLICDLSFSPYFEGVTGEYFIRDKQSRSSEISYDHELARLLWEKSEKLVGQKFNYE